MVHRSCRPKCKTGTIPLICIIPTPNSTNACNRLWTKPLTFSGEPLLQLSFETLPLPEGKFKVLSKHLFFYVCLDSSLKQRQNIILKITQRKKKNRNPPSMKHIFMCYLLRAIAVQVQLRITDFSRNCEFLSYPLLNDCMDM